MPVFDSTTTSDQVISAYASNVQGRTFVITGAGQPSIGSSMAIALAKASPAHILIASRTAAKVQPVVDTIKEANSKVEASFVHVDLSDHASVKRAAQEILDKTGSKIDVLINSAGNMALKEYTLDVQGIEMQLSANHIGHFLLTNLLIPGLSAAAAANKELGARVVNLTSLGYCISPVKFEDWNFSEGSVYDAWTAYGQAKTANILFSYGLTQRLRDQKGVMAVAAHPGSNLDTQLGSHLKPEDYNDIFEITKRNTGQDFLFDEPRFKTYTQIGATPLAAALDPAIVKTEDVYVQNCEVVKPRDHARNTEAVESLWALSEELVKQEFKY